MPQRLLIPLVVVLAFNGMGCGMQRALISEQRSTIDSLTIANAGLQASYARLQERFARAENALEQMRTHVDTLQAMLEGTSTQQEVMQQRLARQVDSLRHDFILQFNRGLELNKMLRGQTLEVIHFPPASTDVAPDAAARLDRLAVQLRELPETARILVEGHADDTSFLSNQKQQNNRVLSAERAAAVVRYLVERYGFAPERFETAGYGSDMPLVPNGDAEGRRINRRVRIAVMATS